MFLWGWVSEARNKMESTGKPAACSITGSFPHCEGLTLKLYTLILPTSITPLTTLWAWGYAYPQLGLHSGGLTAEEALEMVSGPLKQGILGALVPGARSRRGWYGL